MRHTIVCFHAHPDDEALLMGGTMARLSAQGHRVVLVTATAGEAGLASAELAARQPLGERRGHELTAAAHALGCARAVLLGFADSGMAEHPSTAPNAFSRTPVPAAAVALAQLLAEEDAGVLTIYDPAGGYGHPDHVQVHRAGLHAAALAGTPVVLEATVDRRALQRALRVVRPFTRGSADLRPSRFDDLFADPSRITHRVDVTGFLDQKRAAMQAHASQMTADGDAPRILSRLLQLPVTVFRLAMGREWFVEHGRTPTRKRLDDVLATLR
ncbi:MAG: PIG-L family deacetylase [Jatrophihabitantaceae bacterium]